MPLSLHWIPVAAAIRFKTLVLVHWYNADVDLDSYVSASRRLNKCPFDVQTSHWELLKSDVRPTSSKSTRRCSQPGSY